MVRPGSTTDGLTDETSSSAGAAPPSRTRVDDGNSSGQSTGVPHPGGIPKPPGSERPAVQDDLAGEGSQPARSGAKSGPPASLPPPRPKPKPKPKPRARATIAEMKAHQKDAYIRQDEWQKRREQLYAQFEAKKKAKEDTRGLEDDIRLATKNFDQARTRAGAIGQLIGQRLEADRAGRLMSGRGRDRGAPSVIIPLPSASDFRSRSHSPVRRHDPERAKAMDRLARSRAKLRLKGLTPAQRKKWAIKVEKWEAGLEPAERRRWRRKYQRREDPDHPGPRTRPTLWSRDHPLELWSEAASAASSIIGSPVLRPARLWHGRELRWSDFEGTSDFDTADTATSGGGSRARSRARHVARARRGAESGLDTTSDDESTVYAGSTGYAGIPAFQLPPPPLPIVPLAPGIVAPPLGLAPHMPAAPVIAVGNNQYFATSWSGLVFSMIDISLPHGTIRVAGQAATIQCAKRGAAARGDIAQISKFIKKHFKLGGFLNQRKMTSQRLIRYIVGHLPGTFVITS